MFVPKIVTTLKGYSRPQLFNDLTAGIIVGVVALPLAIAFAIASGVTPDRGLYTAIVAGFIISVLGGSRVQIGGPTGAFVVIVYGIVQRYGLDGLTVATLMAGVILVAMGLTRLGGAIKFIPFPVTTGFTSAIAVTIAIQQIDTAAGLEVSKLPANAIERLMAYGPFLHTVNPWALGVTAFTLVVLILWPRVSTKLPAPFVALIVTTAVVQLLHLPVETIGGRFGEIHAGLPQLTVPALTFPMVRGLVGPAFTIAALGAIESLLSATVADGMIGGKHRSNMELVAQGAANIASPLFGGIPATGAIARTATNIKNGGRTPIAGIMHAATLLLITLFFGRWAALIPMATLAGILLIVCYHMSEWRNFRAELKAPKSDVAVLLTTFALTLIVDLTVGIGVGMVLAAFLFMRRMSEVTNVRFLTRELEDQPEPADDPNAVAKRSVPKGVQVYEIDGPFFFGAAEHFRETIGQVATKPKVLIVRMRHVPAVDSTGMRELRDLVRRARRDGIRFILSDVHAQPLVAMGKSGLLDEIGDDHIFGNIDDALNEARAELGLPPVSRPSFAIPAAGVPAVDRGEGEGVRTGRLTAVSRQPLRCAPGLRSPSGAPACVRHQESGGRG